MKSNVVIYWLLAIFFLIIGSVYTAWNLIAIKEMEWAGTLTIYLCGVLMAFIAYYVAKVHKAQGGEMPSDLLSANIDDGDPEMGEFSPWSWWPMILALSLGIFLVGLSVGNGFWLVFLSVPLLLVAIVGWVFEYYRGHFAR